MTRICTLLVLAACVVGIVGCGTQTAFTYEPDVGSYSIAGLESLASGLELPPFAGDPVADAPGLRHEALIDLRKQGDEPASLANLLTQEFPADSRAVPFWAGTARVDGKEAWLVAEVWGLRGGSLDTLRIWAFDRSTGDVLASTVIR